MDRNIRSFHRISLTFTEMELKTIYFTFSAIDWFLRLRSGQRIGVTETSTIDLIKKYGYPAETHKVVTEDDYILELHRIPHGKASNSTRDIPIMLQHGLFSSSEEFVGLKEQSLALLLSDAGYDVWMGNFRGNKYSRAHKYISPEISKFWDFSWHEYGFYDLTACIDYIRNYTRAADVLLIANSVGTTAFFVMASTRPEYHEKLRGVVQMGPVATLQDTMTPLRILIPYSHLIQTVAKFISTGEIGANTLGIKNVGSLMCSLMKETYRCSNFVFFLTGSNAPEFEEDGTSADWGQYFSTSSLKTLAHFGQLIESGKFQEFDYGVLTNWQKYNQDTPPVYNLESIRTPVSLFLAPRDFFVTKRNLRRLLERLKCVKAVYVVPDERFTHLDFTMGKNAKRLVYDAVLDQVEFLIRKGNVTPSVTYFDNIYDKIVF